MKRYLTLGELRIYIDSIDTKYDHLPLTLSDRHNFIVNITLNRDRVPAPVYSMGRDITHPPKTHYYKLIIKNERDMEIIIE